jgi:hypothetical protein
MQSVKLIVWEWLVDGRRWWFPTKRAARWAIVAVSLASGFLIAAQEPDAPPQTNDAMAAEVLARLSDLAQAADSAQPEDMASPNDLTPTNGSPQANGLPQAAVRTPSGDRPDRANRFDNSSGSPNDDRRSRGRRSLRSRSDRSGGPGSANDYARGSDRSQTNSTAGTNNGPVSLDYAAFKVIAERNIFDPNRFPHRPGMSVRPKPRSVDSLTLVGIMSYEKGTFAFFDGTSSEYRKALKLTDAIAGYKVTNIAPNGVKLASGTNELELSVGAQLRREEGGPWQLGSQTGSYAATPASTSTNATPITTTTDSDAAAGGSKSDILKILMQRREKE